ncbi:MAG: polysaccharide deacetylase family protein [Chloroflexi bacterium]|nr:polysaccharide deacetylase family protein [Chloroflexota bacterium]
MHCENQSKISFRSGSIKIHFLLLFLPVMILFACTSAAPTTATPSPIPFPTLTYTPIPTSTPLPFPTPTLPAILITSGEWTEPYVALTFDMCQDPEYPAGYDAGIVDVLQRYNAPATFFMGGDWMRTHPEETKILAANANFELGNHSWSHPDLTRLTEAEIGEQVELTEDMLFQLTGRHSRLFRPPSGFYNELTLRVIAQHGMYTIEWDSVSGDPDPTFDAATILAEVQRTVRNGSIIIMHANGRGWHTAEALPSVIEYLQNRGYTLVTVSQLIGLEPATP